MIDDTRVQQMRALRGIRAAPHQRAIQMRRQRADILRDVGGQLQRTRQNLRRVREGFGEQIAKMLGIRRVDGAG